MANTTWRITFKVPKGTPNSVEVSAADEAGAVTEFYRAGHTHDIESVEPVEVDSGGESAPKPKKRSTKRKKSKQQPAAASETEPFGTHDDLFTPGTAHPVTSKVIPEAMRQAMVSRHKADTFGKTADTKELALMKTMTSMDTGAVQSYVGQALDLVSQYEGSNADLKQVIPFLREVRLSATNDPTLTEREKNRVYFTIDGLLAFVRRKLNVDTKISSKLKGIVKSKQGQIASNIAGKLQGSSSWLARMAGNAMARRSEKKEHATEVEQNILNARATHAEMGAAKLAESQAQTAPTVVPPESNGPLDEGGTSPTRVPEGGESKEVHPIFTRILSVDEQILTEAKQTNVLLRADEENEAERAQLAEEAASRGADNGKTPGFKSLGDVLNGAKGKDGKSGGGKGLLDSAEKMVTGWLPRLIPSALSVLASPIVLGGAAIAAILAFAGFASTDAKKKRDAEIAASKANSVTQTEKNQDAVFDTDDAIADPRIMTGMEQMRRDIAAKKAALRAEEERLGLPRGSLSKPDAPKEKVMSLAEEEAAGKPKRGIGAVLSRLFGFDNTPIVPPKTQLSYGESTSINKETYGTELSPETLSGQSTSYKSALAGGAFKAAGAALPIIPKTLGAKSSVAPSPAAPTRAVTPSTPTSASPTKMGAGYTAVDKALEQVGFTSAQARGNVLGQMGRESGGDLTAVEKSYAGTKYENAKKIFIGLDDPKSYRYLTKEQWDEKRKDPKALLDHMYGKIGGYEYRGRGPIQLTGKENYARYTKLLKGVGVDVDLVKNPDLAADPKYSPLITALYMKDRLTGNGKRPLDMTVAENMETVTQQVTGTKRTKLVDGKRVVSEKGEAVFQHQMALANQFKSKLGFDNTATLAPVVPGITRSGSALNAATAGAGANRTGNPVNINTIVSPQQRQAPVQQTVIMGPRPIAPESRTRYFSVGGL